MQKRLFNHLNKSGNQPRLTYSPDNLIRLAGMQNKFAWQAYEVIAAKYAAFLSHIVQPLHIREKFYSRLQFVFGLPYLLRRDRVIYRQNKSSSHTHFVRDTRVRFVNKLSYLQQVSQAIQGSQKKISNLRLLMPQINQAQINYSAIKSMHGTREEAIPGSSYRENKFFVSLQYVSESLAQFVNRISNYQQVIPTSQNPQKETKNFSVIQPRTIVRNLHETAMSLLKPILNRSQIGHNKENASHRISRQTIYDSIAKPERLTSSLQSHFQPAKHLIVPGRIKERANLNETAQLDDHYRQAEHNISPDFVEKRNFKNTFLQKNIFNKVNCLQKSYVRNAPPQTFIEAKNPLQDNQRSLGKLLTQPMSRAIVNHKKETLERIRVNDVATIVENSSDGRSEPLMGIQRYSSLPAVKSSLVTSFEQQKLSRLFCQAQQDQENMTHAVKKQKPLQQSPADLVHPQSASVTTSARKDATETISDSKQHPAFSLPRPTGIADAAKINNFTDLGELTDKVMEQIEQRIRTERERRGIFV